MKQFNFFLTIILAISLSISCNKEQVSDFNKTSDLGYNEADAKKYGADDYGMKKYVMAFLRKGPNRDLPKEEADKLQAAHMENIGNMAEAGKLVLAGPFFGDGDLRGIYIFDVTSIEEAKALTNSDPAIQAGSLEMELMEWYGSAGLMAVNDIHKSISKSSH